MTEAIYYILLSLRRANHGYGIIQEVSDMTGGRVNLGPGTLYGAINGLLEKGWIVLVRADIDARKKKEYIITDKGREAFAAERKRLAELLENGQKMEE